MKEVQEFTGGEGVDASITISDHATAAGLACAITKRHGLMVQVAQVAHTNLTNIILTD